jgi:Flp pilus assembly protein TadG
MNKLVQLLRTCPYHFARLAQAEQGVSLLYFALLLPMLVGMAALALDGSNLYAQQWRMQLAADSAALAGARQLALGGETAQVAAEVQSLAQANAAASATWSYLPVGSGVMVTTTQTPPAYFGAIFGHNTYTVQATAAARTAPASSVGNLLPMTIQCDDMSNDGDPAFTYGAIYTLWDDAKDAPGSVGWLDWNGGSHGTPELIDNIENPSNSGVWHIGDLIPAAPGKKNAAGVWTALQGWVGKKIILPLFDIVTGNGSNTHYRVCAFAEFTILEASRQDSLITGSFSRTIQRGEIAGVNAPDFGVRTIRLSQ